MRIDSPNLVGSTVITGSAVVTGSVVPGSDLLYDFGSSFKRWGNVYAVNLSGSFTGSNVATGQVIVAGTGGVLSGTNGLFWDNSSVRLGIGTSSPTSTLTLSGSSTATIPVLTLRQGAVTLGAASLDVQNRQGSSTFWVSGSGTSFFSGSVGIGVVAPSAALFVSGTNNPGASTLVVREGLLSPTGNAEALDVQKNNGSSLFWVSGSGISYFSGSVGIGASQPAGRLEVSGVSGSLLLVTDVMSGSLFSVNNVSGLPIFEVFSDDTVVAGGYNSNSLVVSGSRVSIGSTVSNTIQLVVSGSSVASDQVLVVRSGVAIPTSAYFDVQNSSGTSHLSVLGSGNVGIGTTITGDKLTVNGSLSVTGSLQPGTSNSHTLGSSTKLWSTVFATSLSGSLTKLSNGSDYLIAGSNITLTTGSNGAITITGTSTGTVAGTGTINQVARWTATNTIGTGVIFDNGTNVGIGSSPGGDKFSVNGSMSVTGSLLPGSDVTYALGSETKRWQHIYTGDLHLKNERGDWTIIEEEDCLTMRNNKTGKRYRINMTPMPELDEPLGSFSAGPKMSH